MSTSVFTRSDREYRSRYGTRKAARRREQLGRTAVQAALAAPDADDILESGTWAGFPKGRAIAWCWNLFQYEPHNFTYPLSMFRELGMRILESGGVPDGFGYADRARELEQMRVTPEGYRKFKEERGAPTFSVDDVTSS